MTVCWSASVSLKRLRPRQKNLKSVWKEERNPVRWQHAGWGGHVYFPGSRPCLRVWGMVLPAGLYYETLRAGYLFQRWELDSQQRGLRTCENNDRVDTTKQTFQSPQQIL